MSRSKRSQCSVGRGCPVCGDNGETRRKREALDELADMTQELGLYEWQCGTVYIKPNKSTWRCALPLDHDGPCNPGR